MQTNSIMLMANVNRSQINITDTHYNIKSIPITVDDAVMNGVLYSATENAKGMQSMMGNPVTEYNTPFITASSTVIGMDLIL